MWKMLLNKYVLGGLLVVGLLALVGMQELRYRDTLLTLQDTENSFSQASQELLQSQLRLEDAKTELNRQIEIANKSERVSRDVGVQIKALRGENKSLRSSISILKKEYADVKTYLDSVVPDSVSDSLRE